MTKLRIGIVFGGKSAEHEVSIKSAKNVKAALDPAKYEVTEIFIAKDRGLPDLALVQAQDVIFPVLHGPFGEDGTVQGLFKLAGIPFVGPSVLGSAVGMDKDVMKRLLKDAGLPVGAYAVLHAHEKDSVDLEGLIDRLKLPIFVKPANLGSSVGISKAKNRDELVTAIREAFRFDRKIILEEFIEGREIEVAVLGNENPEASVPGEIVPQHEFYSYEAKYVDDKGALLNIPAQVDEATSARVRELAIKVFRALECEGMGRVDFFLKQNGEIMVNEINTIPGFTKISMYPKLWEASGISYAQLIDRLIELARARFAEENRLTSSYS